MKVRGRSFAVRRALVPLLLVVPMVVVPAAAAHAGACTPDKWYKVTSRLADGFVQLGPRVALINKSTTQTATMGKVLTVTGTVNVSLSYTAGVSGSIVVASVNASYQVGASVSISGSDSVSASMTVRPLHTGYITGGIGQIETTGTWYTQNNGCGITANSETAKSPYEWTYITSGG
jgi:hypothetical protein